MKKIAISGVCVLLFCGGLFCIHLTAQSGRLGNASSSAEPISLLDPKITELGERELLERKVASHRQLAEVATMRFEQGSPRGGAIQLAEAHAGLAAAEIELYRRTGEQEKLLAAHKTRVEALTKKLRAVMFLYKEATSPTGTLDALCEAEIQLLDALLEQKREQAR